MRIKKYNILLISVLTAFLLASCGSAGSEETASSSAAESQQESVDPESSEAEAAPESGQTEDGASSGEEETLALRTFTGDTLDGSHFGPEDLARADLTVINIWQTTCGPCIMEMPELAALTEKIPENVQLLTWCVDASRNSEKAKEILDDAGFMGITLTGGDGDLQTVLSYIMYTPTTIFVGSDGTLVGEPIIGAAEDVETQYLEAIESALGELNA